MTSAPSRAALAALCVLVALGGAFVLVLYALTTPAQRPELLGKLAAPLAATVAGVPAFLAWLSAGRLAKAHETTSAAVDRVEQQTNGELTKRIKDANDALREELLAALIPEQRGRRNEDLADELRVDKWAPRYRDGSLQEPTPAEPLFPAEVVYDGSERLA